MHSRRLRDLTNEYGLLRVNDRFYDSKFCADSINSAADPELTFNFQMIPTIAEATFQKTVFLMEDIFYWVKTR